MSERDRPQTTLLRLAAFIIDALAGALALIIPATLLSYGVAWYGASSKTITLVWWGALLLLILTLLLRDGIRGRSHGKRIMGLRLDTADGRPCGYGRSLLRNLPLIVPGWNVIELVLLAFSKGSRRTGDRMAGTTVIEE